jgi:hypothetical protein
MKVFAGRPIGVTRRHAVAIQPKLTVGSRGDRFEEQADRTAAEVTRDPKDRLPFQATDFNPGGRGGRPLPAAVRSYFERRLGHDFSRVRVHADASAARSAGALGAQAYTLGRNVIFGAGQYAPHTQEGRGLLAHELTHVIQRNNDAAAPKLQPRLKVSGNKKDIKAFLELLESASGFTLKRDRKNGEVSITASVLKPPSYVLAGELMTIILDADQDAEIHLGRTQEGVHLGKFPDLPKEIPETGVPKDLVQEIRIDEMLAFEEGAPGSGAASLAHEIIENYHAHDPKRLEKVRKTDASDQPSAWEDVFHETHAVALEMEDLITGELGYQGPRRNTFEMLTGKKPHRTLKGIEDHDNFFIVYDRSFGSTKDVISNVRRVPRVRVSRYIITGFKPGDRSLPDQATAILEQAATDMEKNPTASARIEGLINVYVSPGTKLDVAERWAELAEFYLERELRAITPDSTAPVLARIYSLGAFTRKRNRVVITVDRPDL